MKKIFFSIFFLFFLLSCKKKEYFGTYVANHKEGADTIIINPDFTYKHNFVSNSGSKFGKNEKWEYGEEDGWIDFKNFDWYLKGYGKPKNDTTTISYWMVEIQYDFLGNPSLIIDEDRSLRYKHISTNSK